VINVTFTFAPFQIQNVKSKGGGTWHIMSPSSEKVGVHVPRVPHLIAPLSLTTTMFIDAFK